MNKSISAARAHSIQEGSAWSIRDFILITGVFLLLYLPFLSINSDPNGVVEAAKLKPGSPISHNHIIYGAVGKVFYGAAQAAGYQGKSLYALEVLNAICGAVGVALAFVAFQKLGATRRAALVAAVLWGTSAIYWMYSTDVSYVTLAALFTVAALLCRTELSTRRSLALAFLLGLLFSLATLTFQMMCFMAPVLLWPRRERGRETFVSLATVGLIVGGSYLALGLTSGRSNPIEIIQWIGSYAGGRLPQWGIFDFSRVSIAVEAAVRSFQADAFERVRDFIHIPTRLYVWRIGVGAVCLGAFAIVTLFLSLRQISERNWKFIWMIASYLIFFPFIVWFSPSESFFFLIPNLFLCGAVALAWGPWMTRPAWYPIVFGGVAIMATTTFISVILPNHVDPGVPGRKVDCIAQFVRPDDKLIATDWTWPVKLEYFHGIESIAVIDLAVSFHDSDKLFRYISDEVQKVRRRHGRVFIIDPGSYSPQHLEWLAEQTGFTAADFERYPGKVAFQCEDSKFREVASAR